MFGALTNEAAARANLGAFIVLLLVLAASSAWLLVIPYVKEVLAKRTDWPASLGRDVPEIRYYPFANYVNVFPPWQPGTKNPIALPPKVFGKALAA